MGKYVTKLKILVSKMPFFKKWGFKNIFLLPMGAAWRLPRLRAALGD